MKNILFAILFIILLINGCVGQQEQQTIQSEQEQQIIPPEQPKQTIPSEQEQSTVELKEFTMTAKQFSFSPNTITVNKGDTVKISITSADVTHGFTIGEFGINVQLSPGKTEVVEFVADKQGTFTFYCSVPCGSGHTGMKGQLIVR